MKFITMVLLSSVAVQADTSPTVDDLFRAPVGSWVNICMDNSRICYGNFGNQTQEGRLTKITGDAVTIAGCSVPKSNILFVRFIKDPSR